MTALIPSFDNLLPKCPPVLLSLIPPVSGLFPPIEIFPVVDKLVSENQPCEMMNLFLRPRGSQVGSTS